MPLVERHLFRNGQLQQLGRKLGDFPNGGIAIAEDRYLAVGSDCLLPARGERLRIASLDQSLEVVILQGLSFKRRQFQRQRGGNGEVVIPPGIDAEGFADVGPERVVHELGQPVELNHLVLLVGVLGLIDNRHDGRGRWLAQRMSRCQGGGIMAEGLFGAEDAVGTSDEILAAAGVAGVNDLNAAEGFSVLLQRRHAMPGGEVGELGQRGSQRQHLVVLHAHAGAGDDQSVFRRQQAVEQLAADLEAPVGITEQLLPFGQVFAVPFLRGDGIVVVAGKADHPKRHPPQRNQRRRRDHAGSKRLLAHRGSQPGCQHRLQVMPGHGHVCRSGAPGGGCRLPKAVKLTQRGGEIVTGLARKPTQRPFKQVAPFADRAALGRFAVEFVEDPNNRDQRSQ